MQGARFVTNGSRKVFIPRVRFVANGSRHDLKRSSRFGLMVAGRRSSRVLALWPMVSIPNRNPQTKIG